MGLRIDKKTIDVKKEKEMMTQKIKNTKGKRQKGEVGKSNNSGSKKEQSDKKKEAGSLVKKITNEKEWLNKEEENKIVKLNATTWLQIWIKFTGKRKLYEKRSVELLLCCCSYMLPT
jgi:hypothetical protein